MATRIYHTADAPYYQLEGDRPVQQGGTFYAHGPRIPYWWPYWATKTFTFPPVSAGFWNRFYPLNTINWVSYWDGQPRPYLPYLGQITKEHSADEYDQYIEDSENYNGLSSPAHGSYPFHNLLAVVFTKPLRGNQTIAGTFRSLLFAKKRIYNSGNAGANCVVRVVSGDGQTERGVLYAGDTRTSVASGEGLSYSNQFSSRWFPQGTGTTGVTLNSVNALDGDRIVIELGATSYDSGGRYPSILLGFPNPPTADLTTSGTLSHATFEATQSLSSWSEFSATLAFQGDVSGDVVIDMGGWAGLKQNPPIGGTAALDGHIDLDVGADGYLVELRPIFGTLDVDVQAQGYLVKALFGSVDLDVGLDTDLRIIQPAPVTYATLPMQWLADVLVERETMVRFGPLQIHEIFTLGAQATMPIIVPDHRPPQPVEDPEAPGVFGPPVVGGIDIRALYGVTVIMPVPQVGNGQPVGDNADQWTEDPVPPDYGGGDEDPPPLEE